MRQKISLLAVPLGALLSLTPWVNSAVALALGVFIALTLGNPYLAKTRKLTRPMLSAAIIALGAGMNLMVVGKAGLQGVLITMVVLSATLTIGALLGRLLKIELGLSVLINVGTAICGGSAIAAVSSALRSKEHEISVALAIVFILNACALVIFPPLGHYFGLTESQFGMWAALAVHDTSSVVGTTLQYGPKALEVGTTVKLVRALWIIPVTFVIARIYQDRKTQEGSLPRQHPWFILGFVIASAIVTFIPATQGAGHVVETMGRHVLVATLFLIGSGLTAKTLKQVGFKPLLHGVLLWLIVAVGNLTLILYF